MTKSALGLACMALSLAFSAPALAAPTSPSLADREIHSGPLTLVRGCHREPQTHGSPALGGTVRHYHVGKNCRPVATKTQPRRR
jgi:hypothetical protein